MNARDFIKQYEEKHLRCSREVFSRHELRRNDPDHWRIQRRYPDTGAWDSTYSADIVCMEPGTLVVTGDIDLVAFAYGPPDPRARLRWMGRCTDIGYYVCQKARMGTGCVEAVEDYNSDVARSWLLHSIRDQLLDLQLDADKEDGSSATRGNFHEMDDDAVIALAEASEDKRIVAYVEAMDLVHERHELLDHLYKSGEEEFGDIGMVVSPRVYYAHAAMAKLCDLLDALDPAEAKDG